MKRAIINLWWIGILVSTTLSGQTFNLKTDDAGISSIRRTNGVAVADYDLDGYLDVYIVAAFRFEEENEDTWNRFYKNNGDGTFTDVTVETGLSQLVEGVAVDNVMGHKFGAAWGDYNNDGHPDRFLANAGPNQFFHNLGNGTFSDVTDIAGVQGSDTTFHASPMWWDFDLDGDLDLHIGDWLYKNTMYENLGDGTFLDITESSGLGDTGHTWASAPIDANNDGLPDLYNVNDHGENYFFLNLGDKTFREATAEYGLEDPGHGMGVDLGDYNNDGFFDIYLTNIADIFPNPLFTNTGQGMFIDKARELGVEDAGWGWGTEFFDCDHDGDLDLYATNGSLVEPDQNRFFNNMLIESGSSSFQNISAASGTNGEKEARGLVVFDYDNDGDLDMLVSNRDNTPDLYRNQSITQNYLKVDLEGTISNRNAFGAVVRVTANGNVYHRLNDGVDFLGQSIQAIHFGLGAAEMAEEVYIRWPNGLEESVYNITVNQTLKVREGQGVITGIADDSPNANIPGKFALFGNYPNPFNPTTNIGFSISDFGFVELKIYDAAGRLVKTLVNENRGAGLHSVQWDATNDLGQKVVSGIYLYKLQMGSQVEVKKMVLMK